MDKINSKDILILFISIIGTLLLTLTSFQFDIFNFGDQEKSNITIILIIIVAAVGIIWILYKKFREVNEELEKNKIKLEEFDKRFKMIEELNDIRLNIRELQKEVNKSGNKK
ncbi:MAG: hypothetical protein AABX03_02595 [Nanoarchaeota archaeon]